MAHNSEKEECMLALAICEDDRLLRSKNKIIGFQEWAACVVASEIKCSGSTTYAHLHSCVLYKLNLNKNWFCAHHLKCGGEAWCVMCGQCWARWRAGCRGYLASWKTGISLVTWRRTDDLDWLCLWLGFAGLQCWDSIQGMTSPGTLFPARKVPCFRSATHWWFITISAFAFICDCGIFIYGDICSPVEMMGVWLFAYILQRTLHLFLKYLRAREIVHR